MGILLVPTFVGSCHLVPVFDVVLVDPFNTAVDLVKIHVRARFVAAPSLIRIRRMGALERFPETAPP